MGDAVTQDNAAGDLNSRVFPGGFGDFENKLFLNSAAGKTANLSSSFSIRSYVNTLRRVKGLHGDVLVRDTIVSAFIKFTYELWRDAWADIHARSKAAARKHGRTVAVYGNIGHKYPAFELVESSYQDVYWIESFVRMATPAQQPEDYPGVDTTITIKAAQAADRHKPVWRCTQRVKAQSEHRIYLAESMANGVNEWLLNGMMESPLPPDQSTTGTWGQGDSYGYEEHLRSARFGLSSARFLLTDRQRVADGAVVYCLACILWRGFVSTLGQSSPLLHQESLSATARLLDHSQTSWEFVAFGHSDLWQPPSHAVSRIAPPSESVIPYSWVVLPYVDAISDADVRKLEDYVEGGGMLVLVGAVTGTLSEDLSPRRQPAFLKLMQSPGRGKVLQISDSEFLAYKDCGGFPSRCLAARQNLWQKFFKSDHESTCRTVLDNAPLSVWLNTWAHGSGSPVAVHLVNYRTSGTLDCNMSVAQPQSGPSECDCSCEVQPHNNSVQNIPVKGSFQVCQRINKIRGTVAWLYAPDRLPYKLATNLTHRPGFVCVTLVGMDVYAVVAFASCDAELQARADASDARKALERLFIVSQSLGVSLYSSVSIRNSVWSAMHSAEVLLGQTQGQNSHSAVDPLWFQMLSSELRNATAAMKALVLDVRTEVESEASQQRQQTLELCTKPRSCLAAFNMGSHANASQPIGFAAVTSDSMFSPQLGYGFLRSSPRAKLSIGTIDSGQPDALHRTALYSGDPAVFRVDLPATGNGKELLITIVTGVRDFAVEPMEFLQTHYAGDFAGLSTTSLMVNVLRQQNHQIIGSAQCLMGARGLSTAYYHLRTCRLRLPNEVDALSLDLVLAPDGGTTGAAAGGNPFAWLTNAILVQHAGTVAPVLQPGLARSDRLSLISQRHWHWVGPFDMPENNDLHTQSALETQIMNSLPMAAVNGSKYHGKFGKLVQWKAHNMSAVSAAPYLSLSRLIEAPEGATIANSVAFCMCRVLNPSSSVRSANYIASMSGQGTLFMRSEFGNLTEVYEDTLIFGLTEDEDHGTVLLKPGWTTFVFKTFHQFASTSVHEPIQSFPNTTESETWAHSLGLVTTASEWAVFLAIDWE
eukprot:SAG31_NODE_1417_length_8440_cov_7.706510_6_plen_1098_part_00